MFSNFLVQAVAGLDRINFLLQAIEGQTHFGIPRGAKMSLAPNEPI